MKGKDRTARTHRIADWDAEDAVAWDADSNVIARHNLIWSIVTTHVAFSIFYLGSAMVLFMPQSVCGFSTDDKLRSRDCCAINAPRAWLPAESYAGQGD